MAKPTTQVEDLVKPILRAGEHLVGTAWMNYNGTIAPNVAQLEAAMVVVEDHQRPPPDPDSMFAFPVAKQMALALTDERIFVWSLGLSGKPRQFIGEVPLRFVAGVRSGDARYGATLRLTMKSGALVDLEFMKGEPAEQFTAQLVALFDD